MATVLEKELAKYNVTETVAQFKTIIRKTHRKMYPGLNDEQLLQEPTKAVQFVGAVRGQVGIDIPENLICRTLTNLRKQSRKNGSK